MSHQDPVSTPQPAPGAHQDPVSPPRPSPSIGAPGHWGAGIADPGPVGLAGFAATTFLLSAVNATLLPASVQGSVLGLAIFYGGIVQLLAGLWEFTKGNTFGALAFCSFGGFWLSFWWLVSHGVPDMVAAKASASDIDHAVGTYLLIWTIFTFYMLIASLRTTGAVAAVFLFLAFTFLFLTVGWYGGGDVANSGWTKVGGWLGLITAVLAWYASFAAVVNATFKRVVAPVFPL